MNDEEILEMLNIPGLNVEASFEPRELPILLDGVRDIITLERQRERALVRTMVSLLLHPRMPKG